MEKEAPREPRKPLSPQELYNFEDAEAQWQDKDRWDTTDYSYPVGGWDILMPMTDEDIENLTRYSG